MPTETCEYCRGVGACPTCWGRSAITELKAQNEKMRDLLKGCDYIFRRGVPVSNQSTLASDIRSLLASLEGQ